MDIYQAIKKDHSEVKALFEEIKKKKGGRPHHEIFEELKNELLIHSQNEEELFYPALLRDESLKSQILEGIEEHNLVKTVLQKMDKVDVNDEKWLPLLKVLQDLVDNHVQEEEGAIFRKAHKFLEKGQAQDMGRKFEESKDKMMAGAH